MSTDTKAKAVDLQTSEPEDKRSSGRAGGAAAVAVAVLLLLLPVGYVLSIGPAIWLDSRGYIHVEEDSLIAKFYFPIIYAAESVPMLDSGLTWYADLWDKPAQSWTPMPPAANPVPVPLPAPTGVSPPPVKTPTS
jgi:hypothetical protein